jgi:hypothetical protein
MSEEIEPPPVKKDTDKGGFPVEDGPTKQQEAEPPPVKKDEPKTAGYPLHG